MPAPTFVQCYKMTASIGTPSIANLYVAEATIKESVDEIDTTESESGDGSAAQAGYSDVFPGVRTLEITARLQHRSAGTLVATFAPGAVLTDFKIVPVKTAPTNAWTAEMLVVSAEHPVKIRNGVWEVSVTLKSRGYYTRPAAIG